MNIETEKIIEKLDKLIYYSIFVAFLFCELANYLFDIQFNVFEIIRVCFCVLFLAVFIQYVYAIIFKPFLIKGTFFPSPPRILYNHGENCYVNPLVVPISADKKSRRDILGFFGYFIEIKKRRLVKVVKIIISVKKETIIGSGKIKVYVEKLSYPPDMKYDLTTEGYHEFSLSKLPERRLDFYFRHKIKETIEKSSNVLFFDFEIDVIIYYNILYLSKKEKKETKVTKIEIIS